MRTQAFISSMVLSVACVSAANAAVVDPFTVASSATDGAGTVTETPITGGLWDTRYTNVQYRTNITNRATASLVVDASTNAATFTVTRVGAANFQNDQSGALEYDNAAGVTDVSNFTSLTFNYTSTFSALLFEIDLGGKIATKTISASAGGTFTLLASELTVDGAPGGYMNIVLRQDNSNASGTFTMTNLVANGISVPAPGAAALIGLAGLVASRRRRN
jgi:MYXO-CTERM domain-containing protein